jgi:hypothetical protein
MTKTIATKKVRLGFCAVDSGTILITDPGYLNNWKDNGFGESESVGEYSYGGACDRTLTTGYARYNGQLNFSAGHGGIGVVSRTGLGDGVYPVYATVADLGEWGERVVKVEIEFIDLTDEAWAS